MNGLPKTKEPSNIEQMLNNKLEELGIRIVHVSWNEEFMCKIRNMSDGPEKDKLVDDGVVELFKSIIAVQAGDYTDITELVDDTPPMDPKIQKIINSVTIADGTDSQFC